MSDLLPTYNLKAVTRETGLNPETIRAWERRYGLPIPRRTPGGHRLYSQRDIQMLKWLVKRQEEGMSISRAVDRWRSLENSGQDPLQPLSQVANVYPGATTLADLRQTWINACLDFDEPAAEQALSQAFAIASPEFAASEVLQRGIGEIGELWYQGKASVQQEHFASSLVARRLHSLIAAAPPPTRQERLLAACPAAEEHEIGLLFSTFLLRRQGWDVIHLGANVPLLRLEETIASVSPTLVISTAETLPAAAELMEMALFLQDHGVRLAFGGRVFTTTPSLVDRIPAHYLGSQLPLVPLEVDRVLRQKLPVPAREQPSPEYEAALSAFSAVQPRIAAAIASQVPAALIHPAHLETANHFLGSHLTAALRLGDIALLGSSIDWIEGMLSHTGLNGVSLRYFLSAYRQAVTQFAGEAAAVVIEWLERTALSSPVEGSSS